MLFLGLAGWVLKAFGWCSITPMSVLLTFLAVVCIYLFTCSVHYLVDKKHTTLMNQQLKKRYSNAEKPKEQKDV